MTGLLYIQFIKKEYSQAKLEFNVCFHIASPDGYIELKFNAPQEKPFTGWSIKPRMTPCRVCYTV